MPTPPFSPPSISPPNVSPGFLTPSALWMPAYLAAPSAWVAHGPFMFWLMDVLRPKLAVELGTHYGYSYFCMCQAITRLHLPTVSFAVDNWKGDAHTSHYGNDVYEKVRQHNQQYTKFSTLLRCNFDEAVLQFSDHTIDLLHIDGLHFYEAVAHDFAVWLPKLHAQGIVLFHDTAERGRDFGVWRFFAELKEQYPSFEFLHGHGLGIVAIGEVPPALSFLFSASPHAVSEIRQAFTLLGQNLQKQHHLVSLGSESASQHVDLAEVNSSLYQAFSLVPERLYAETSWLVKAWRFISYPFAGQAFKLSRVRHSAFFDAAWYLKHNPDVAVAGIDPALHYLEYGALEGRDPGPFFSTAQYFSSHPEALQKGVNPLLHYAGFGRVPFPKPVRAHFAFITDHDRSAIHRHMAEFTALPLISVIMPVYNPPENFLMEAIHSVKNQIYPHWELCIANDASTNPSIAKILDDFAAHDSRIKVTHRPLNGHISAASNSALSLATGDYVALLDHDDLLHETALYEVVALINQHANADIIYSDEDRVDAQGVHSAPYHKPDFSPELILGQNMVSHLGVYKRQILAQIGGFREGFEGSQDYDLFLRAWSASATERIYHIPAVLYHWRKHESKTSFSQTQLQTCVRAAHRALADYLVQEDEGAKIVTAPHFADYTRVIRKIPANEPLVSVLIPTRDRHDLLRVCTEGVLQKTDYKNIEVLIIDHDSREPQTKALLTHLQQDPRVRILPYHGVFNYSAMNNMAVQQAQGSLLCFLNNDIEVLSPDWLFEMVSHAIRPRVGAVGAKLLYPSKKIQHAGVVIGLGGVAGHAYCGLTASDPAYFAQAVLARNVSAVTAACLVVRRELFLEVGGFDAENLTVAFNDVDLCLRLQARGYRNIWTPFAELIHHESVSRGPDTTPEKAKRVQGEIRYMKKTWGAVIDNDPFYNPNLSLTSSYAELAKVSRRMRPWQAYLVK